jgi:hypothetical protein
MTNGLLIYGEIFAHFLIYDFLKTSATSTDKKEMRKIFFSFYQRDNLLGLEGVKVDNEAGAIFFFR